MLGEPEVVIVLVLILMLFGSSQIPKLARNLGLAQKELKSAMHGDDDDDEKKPTPTPGSPESSDSDVATDA